METLWGNPLTALTITVVIYVLSLALSNQIRTPLANPILLSVVVVILILSASGVDYVTYQAGGKLLSFWLGPATVALALPLYRQLPLVLKNKAPILAAVTAGSTVAAAAAVGVGRLLGASHEVVLALIPKSVTTPIAIEIAHSIGANRELAAGFVIATGIIGAVIGPECLRLVRVTSPLAQGLAMGTASHGIGTARAIQEGPVQGSTSGLALGLGGIATTLIAPIIALLVG